MANVLRLSLAVMLLLQGSQLTRAVDGPAIRVNGAAAPTIDVTGLSAEDLATIGKMGLKGDELASLFAVYVVPAAGKERGPALLGTYRLEDRVLRFEPRFPLVRGVRYRVVFDPARVSSRAARKEKPIEKEILLEKPKTAATRVTQVYPTADRLPENQLKFYLHFSAPMSRGDSYRHIQLFDEKDKAIDLPFLELDQELWDGDGTRLTLFCDPGRVKRGLKPREELGPVLEEGKRYTLVIARSLEDADGNPLQEAYRKAFLTLPPDDTQPDPKTWKVQAPAAGTREPVTVTFPKPLDHALLHRLMWISDDKNRKPAGQVKVSKNETVWRFTPEKAWQPGTYRLVADTRLEDLAGNSIARPFEVDALHPARPTGKTQVAEVPFEVR